MKVFAIGNLRAGYAAMVVIMGVIIRDLFPDPDVFCKQMRLYQFVSVRKFRFHSPGVLEPGKC